MTAEQSMPGIIAGKTGGGGERGEEGKGEEREERGGGERGERGGEGGGESSLEVGVSLSASSSSPFFFLLLPPSFSLSLLPVICLLRFLFFNLLYSVPPLQCAVTHTLQVLPLQSPTSQLSMTFLSL